MKRAARPLVLALCHLAVLALHARKLGWRGYWEDEIYTARDIGIDTIADRDPAFRLSFSRLTYRNDNHPPLYFWLISRWTAWFGFSEEASRCLSLLFFTSTLLVCAVLIWEWAPDWTGGESWTVLFLGVSPVFAGTAREARMYALALFWASLSLLFFCRVWRDLRGGSAPRWTHLAALSATNALGLYTHYYFAWLWLAEIVLTLVAGLDRRRRQSGSLMRAIGALLASALLFAPWFPQFQRQYRIKVQPGLWVLGPESWHAYFSRLTKAILEPARDLTANDAGWWGTLVAALILASLVAGLRGKGPRSIAVLLRLAGVALSLAVANDLFHHTVTIGSSKYLFACLLPLALAVVAGVAGFEERARTLAMILLVGINLFAMRNHFAQPRHPDWRRIAAAVESTGSLPIVVRDDNHRRCLRFYLRGGRRVVTDRDLSLLPLEFNYLALYPNWSRGNRGRLEELGRHFRNLGVVQVDEFAKVVHLQSAAGSLGAPLGPR